MKPFRTVAWVLLSVFLLAPVAAVVFGEACPEVVHTAMEATDQLCENTGRNQLCYGHSFLEAHPQPGATSFAFSEAGDVVDVTSVQSLRLWPMEPDTGIWGVALMHLQANLPSSQPANVTILTFGDVQIENAVALPTQLAITVAANEYINVRRGPSTQAGVVGVLGPGQTVEALERLEDGSWLRVELPDSGRTGWVSTSLFTTAGDIQRLHIADGWTPHYRPMQAFYFSSGTGDTVCSATPASGMLIQTPEGVGEVILLINEINIEVGSTVFFQAQAGGDMIVTTLEGHADVTAQGITYTAVAGTQVHIPLDANLHPASPPSRPQPYEDAAVQTLPINALAREITITPSLTQEQIDLLLASTGINSGASTGGEGTVPEISSGDTSAPGNSGSAPGQGGTCPGNSCNAPGHGGDCPGNSCNAPGHGGGHGMGNG